MSIASLEEARACAHHLLRSGLRRVIVTLGANGALYASGEVFEHIVAYPANPVDTTGAGDAFIGSFACFMASGSGELEAVKRANVYASLSTLSVGTQTSFVSQDRWQAAWHEWRPHEQE
jgi:ribokinase